MVTSCIYIALSAITPLFTVDQNYASNCVQGLSGPLFALKILCLISAWYGRQKTTSVFTLPSPAILFEFSEMLIILEKRTFLYHLSGMITGIIYCSIIYNWCVKRFPGTGLRLGNRSKPEINQNRQSDAVLCTRSWGYASTRGMPIRRSNQARNILKESNRRPIITENVVSQDNPIANESTSSHDLSINETLMQESQSPPVLNYGGERTDERDITMSPPSAISPLQATTPQTISSERDSHLNENQNDSPLTNFIENTSNERIIPPRPSYFSENSPPQVPAELGGGTYMGDESQSEDENESYSESSGSNSNYSNISNGEPSSSPDVMPRSSSPLQNGLINSSDDMPRSSSPVQNGLEEFSNPVLSVDELRRRRIERFS